MHFKWHFSCIRKKLQWGTSLPFWSLNTDFFFLLMDKPVHIFLLMCHYYNMLPYEGNWLQVSIFPTREPVSLHHHLKQSFVSEVPAGCYDVHTKLKGWSDLPRVSSCPRVTATGSQVSVSQGPEQKGTNASWLQSTFPPKSVGLNLTSAPGPERHHEEKG